jgi:hypothetical protein
MKNIDCLVVEPSSGAFVGDTAEAAYSLSKQLGVRVDYVHNDQRYMVFLQSVPVDPIGKHLCDDCKGRGFIYCETCDHTGRKDKGGR